MNLYLITAPTKGYDVYDSVVVAAETEETARITHPSRLVTEEDWSHDEWAIRSWAAPAHVSVKLIGVADPSISAGVICASFNAG